MLGCNWNTTDQYSFILVYILHVREDQQKHKFVGMNEL